MTVASPPPVLPQTYARWQARLAHSFFAGRAYEPVVLFVDRDELQRLADPGEDGAWSLASAVRQIVDVGRGSGMFGRAQRLEALWRRGPREEPPPTLPILALSVLAASEMRTDASARRNAYYRRLVGALLPDVTDEATVSRVLTALRNGSAFLDVVEMWEQLDRWLREQQGAFGTSTIQAGTANESRIGYPLSQTLVRRSDRAALTRFFSAARLKSAGVPSADSLLRMLRRWVTHRGHGLTDRFVESLSDDEVLPLLTSMLHDLATAWDGKIITAEGLRRLDLRLAVDLDDARTWWVVPAVRDITGDLLRGICGGQAFEALITADPHSTMYRAEGLPAVRASDLASGLVARGERCVAEFQPTKVLVLAADADAGGWMSVDLVQPFEEHVFVSSTDAAGAVNQALRSAADEGWRALDSAFADRLLGSGGFSVFDRVVFSDQERLDNALALMPGSVAAGLRRGAAVRPRLINGLPIDRHIAANVYLAGGEPDLVLPMGDETRYVDVSLDGMTSRLRASLFPIPLSRFRGGMEPTDHTVQVDDETLTFVVERRSLDDRRANVGSIGWIDGALRDSAPDTAEICGALVRDMDVARPVLARRGSAMTILIGADGRMTTISDPPSPTGLPALTFAFFEVPPSTAVWLAQKRTAGWTVTKLRGAEPAFRGLTAADRAVWGELSASVRSPSPLWRLYTQAWERTRAR
ncbi:MAG: hypothetical protein ACTHMS_11745 [Jatrophihabitans sp.]|uniref:hypothetical protein n=1 Tax=Jatrophihabitans sp. TaxID=1932789 RepID=UPI003F82227B